MLGAVVSGIISLIALIAGLLSGSVFIGILILLALILFTGPLGGGIGLLAGIILLATGDMLGLYVIFISVISTPI